MKQFARTKADKEAKEAEQAELAKEQADYLHAEKFKRQFRDSLLAKMDEYVDEAEHQDGFGCWREFKDMREALVDFALYTANSVDSTEENEE